MPGRLRGRHREEELPSWCSANPLRAGKLRTYKFPLNRAIHVSPPDANVKVIDEDHSREMGSTQIVCRIYRPKMPFENGRRAREPIFRTAMGRSAAWSHSSTRYQPTHGALNSAS